MPHDIWSQYGFSPYILTGLPKSLFIVPDPIAFVAFIDQWSTRVGRPTARHCCWSVIYIRDTTPYQRCAEFYLVLCLDLLYSTFIVLCESSFSELWLRNGKWLCFLETNTPVLLGIGSQQQASAKQEITLSVPSLGYSLSCKFLFSITKLTLLSLVLVAALFSLIKIAKVS